MINLNFSNVEELVFENPDAKLVFSPITYNYYEQWRMGKQFSFLRQLGKRSLLDFLNQIDDEQLEKLEGLLGDRVMVERLNYEIVTSLTIPLRDLDKVCERLCQIRETYYYNLWRDDQHLYIILWR